MTLYELAVNPDVQEKLYQEIKENEAKNNEKFDYNSIQNMVYMDMVVSGRDTTLNVFHIFCKNHNLQEIKCQSWCGFSICQ